MTHPTKFSKFRLSRFFSFLCEARKIATNKWQHRTHRQHRYSLWSFRSRQRGSLLTVVVVVIVNVVGPRPILHHELMSVTYALNDVCDSGLPKGTIFIIICVILALFINKMVYFRQTLAISVARKKCVRLMWRVNCDWAATVLWLYLFITGLKFLTQIPRKQKWITIGSMKNWTFSFVWNCTAK